MFKDWFSIPKLAPKGERVSKHAGSNNHSKKASKKRRKMAKASRRKNR